MINVDLFEIDFHIFTDIKFLFNLGVRIKIYVNDNHKSIRHRLSHLRIYERDSDR